MLILGKYKDGYDYLQGVYGSDPKLVLDRRECNLLPKNLSDINYGEKVFKITLYLTGNAIDILIKDGKPYYGEDIRQFEKEGSEVEFLRRYYTNKQDKSFIYINTEPGSCKRIETLRFRSEIYKPEKDLNELHKCPILLKTKFYNSCEEDYDYKFPRLSDLKLESFIDPVEIYKMLSSWLSEQITKKEQESDQRTNDQKIEGRGFDLKTSFRPNMKI